MFKPLIKKVREESTNSSTLPEKTSEEINGHLSKDNQNSIDEESSLPTRTNSTTASNKSKHSNESDRKEESIQDLANIFSPYVDETISIDNYIQVLKSWMDSSEAIFQEKEDAIQRLTQETVDLKNETDELRTKLTDLQSLKEKTINRNPYSQKQTDTLRSENENLKSDNKSLRKRLNDVETERDDLFIKSTDVKSSDDLERQLARQKAETEEQRVEIEKLRRALLERDAIIEQQDKRLLIDRETQAVQTEEDTSFVQVFAEPDVDTIGKLQAELDEKNRTIKNLQQRYNDLRKTLQREFQASIPKDLNQLGSSKTNPATPSSPSTLPLIHYDPSATSQSDVEVAKRASSSRQTAAVRKSVTFTTNPATTVETSPAILPHTSVESKPQRNGHRSSIEGQTATNGTNFKYLKHVLLKFMTSTEDEAIHLIRAVSTLLNFSADEERLLRETLDYKMSWFGKVSRHKSVSSNTNF